MSTSSPPSRRVSAEALRKEAQKLTRKFLQSGRSSSCGEPSLVASSSPQDHVQPCTTSLSLRDAFPEDSTEDYPAVTAEETEGSAMVCEVVRSNDGDTNYRTLPKESRPTSMSRPCLPPPSSYNSDSPKPPMVRKKNELFPKKLMTILDQAEKTGDCDIISFRPHGKTFAVHDVDRFVSEVMPRHFTTLKYTSFVRQLHLYGFRRVSEEDGSFSYFHENFEKNKPVGRLYTTRKRDACRKIPSSVRTVTPPPSAATKNTAEKRSQDPTRSSVSNSSDQREAEPAELPFDQGNVVLPPDHLGCDPQKLLGGSPQAKGLMGATSGAELDLLLRMVEEQELLLRSITGHFVQPHAAETILGASPELLQSFLQPNNPLMLHHSLRSVSTLARPPPPSPVESNKNPNDVVLRRLQEKVVAARKRHATIASLFFARQAIHGQLSMATRGAVASLSNEDEAASR